MEGGGYNKSVELYEMHTEYQRWQQHIVAIWYKYKSVTQQPAVRFLWFFGRWEMLGACNDFSVNSFPVRQ